MSKIPCNIINDLLPLYIDEVCSEESCNAVSEHLKECKQCKSEYENLSKRTPSFNINESNLLLKIAKRWKKTKLLAFITGLAAIIFILTTCLSVYLYATQEIPVASEDITISNLCELSDGKIFFTLKASDSVYVEDVNWSEGLNSVCISFKTKRTQLFTADNYNNQNVSNWVFNVKYNGIRRIYYFYEGENSKPIWDSDMTLKSASEYPQVWSKINKADGNASFADKLLYNLFDNKIKYIGAPSSVIKLLESTGVYTKLGALTIQLHTVKEPFGITLNFKNIVDKDDRKEFDGLMTSYAYVLLALIDNCGEVSWTYPDNVNEEDAEEKGLVTLYDAEVFLGKDVKTYGESAVTVQELLDKLDFPLTN